MNILIKNIKELVQIRKKNENRICGKDMDNLPVLKNAFVFIKDGLIEDFGPMEKMPSIIAKQIDASGKFVLPSYVDSHTHLVFAGSREKEFEMRIKGKPYEEIAAEGGGILNSAKLLQNTSEEDLLNSTRIRLNEIIKLGTGAVEIKSGYGLTFESELKMLRVIKALKKESPIPVKATFLGAHAIPVEYKNSREDYVKLIVDKMIPAVAEEELADYIDVFCDRGFFTAKETELILKVGKDFGMKPKIHANELGYTGGIQAGVKMDALSVDHLECTGDEEIKILKDSLTMPTILPATAFFLGMEYPPARKMIDSGLPLALASDYNPGSCPSGNMNFITSLACIKLKMTPNEVFNAVTLNGAYAMEMTEQCGSITKGKLANLIITKEIPSLSFIPYSFGNQHLDKVLVGGKEVC